MAAIIRRRRFHRILDDTGDRDRELRAEDFAAQGRHRQQARRFRVREDREVMALTSPRLRGEDAELSRGAIRRLISRFSYLDSLPYPPTQIRFIATWIIYPQRENPIE